MNWPGFFTTFRAAVVNIANEIAGFFTVTEEELAQAGIFTGGEGRER